VVRSQQWASVAVNQLSLTEEDSVLNLYWRNDRLAMKLFRGGIRLLMYVLRNSASVSFEGMTLVDELQFVMLTHIRISNHAASEILREKGQISLSSRMVS
jgi:hypothetical protein